MTFLNPVILWGLFAVSIPIIIHIFNLKKTKKIEFSTLMFLKEIQQSKYKKIKLKQLLILLSRILMIIFLVLAFAQPFETGYLGRAGEKTSSSVLILLDDSFSMETRETQGNYFESAKNKATELLTILNESDEIYFTPISKIAGSNNYRDIGKLKDSIPNMKISDVTKSLSEVMYYSKGIIENFSKPYKEVFLITDAQKSFIGTEKGIASVSSQQFNSNVNFNIINIGKRTGNNISLDTINVITKIFEKNKNVKIKCIVSNRNNFNVSNKSILLKFNGRNEYKEEKVVDIPSNSSIDVEYNFKPDISGFAEGSIELIQSDVSDDEISRDNIRYFSFYIPEKINLLIVSSSGSDIEFIKHALNSYEEVIKEAPNTENKFFYVKEINENELNREELSLYNSVLIANKSRFSDAEAEKIKSYIEDGGGLIMFPGKNISAENYNQVLLSKLELPYINSYFGDISGNQISKFSVIDFEHPILAGIYKQQTDIRRNFLQESPKIKYGLNIITDKNSQPIIKLDNEKNFLTEYSHGKGKILFYAVPADMSYSNFPQSSIFPPLIIRSILYPSNKFHIKEATAGDDYFVDLSSLNITEKNDTLTISGLYRIFAPDKQAIINLKDVLFRTSNYKLQSGNRIIYEFPCNFNKSESDLQKLSDDELKKYFKENYDMNINVISGDEKLTASITSLRIGKEIWQYFLIFGLLFLAAEYYLSKSLQ